MPANRAGDVQVCGWASAQRCVCVYVVEWVWVYAQAVIITPYTYLYTTHFHAYQTHIVFFLHHHFHFYFISNVCGLFSARVCCYYLLLQQFTTKAVHIDNSYVLFFRLIFMSGGAKCVAPFGLFAFNDECCEAMFLPTDILYKYVRSYSCVSN